MSRAQAACPKKEGMVIGTIWNRLFDCAHRHLTRPFSPTGEPGDEQVETYVVCLDCTRQFAYDLRKMRVGKAIHPSHEAFVLPPDRPKPRKTKLAYALGIVVPVAVLLGLTLAAKKPTAEK
jgi:hypothetical protein